MHTLEKLRKYCIRVSVGLAVFTPIFMAVSALGSRAGLWTWQFAFGTLVKNYGGKLLLASLICAILALVLSVVVKPRLGKNVLVSVLALCVPLMGIGHGKNVKKKVGALPFIHDITTDTQDVPTFSSAIRSARGENSNTLDYAGKVDARENKLVSVLQAEAYPEIRTLELADSIEVTFGRAEATAKAMGWEIVTNSAKTGVIEATATTFWFGFKDDIVVRVRENQGGGSLVDIRSVSRVGKSDIGANAARIHAFKTQMSK